MGLTLKHKGGSQVIDVSVGKEAIPKEVAKKVVGKEAHGEVKKQHPDGSTDEAKESLGVVVSNSPLATVNVSLGMTKNLGNFESLKMSVSCTIPSLVTEEALEKAFDFAKGWCDDHLNQIVAEVNSELGQ